MEGLVETYGLKEKTLVDVGCGKGYFLNNMCKLGNNSGVGIDPSYSETDEIEIDRDSITFIRDYYSEKYHDHKGYFVSCRHVIDELSSPKPFLATMKGSMDPDQDSLLMLEVPNALKTFSQNLIWNIGYAKRSWFTPSAMGKMFKICGLEPVDIEPAFGEEYQHAVAKLSKDGAKNVPFSEEESQEMISLLEQFVEHFQQEVEKWEKKIAELEASNQQLAIWGAGMRGLNFLAKFNNKKVITHIVDINPMRQGSYLPGSGYKIDGPEILREVNPSTILISNPNYAAEIEAQVKEMGITCDFMYL